MNNLGNLSIADGRTLTPMQTRFVSEYLADSSSQEKAAIRAGYSPKSAEAQAVQLMKDPRIQKLLQDARDSAVKSLGLTQQMVLVELWKVAGANPGDVIVLNQDGDIDIQATGAGEVAVTKMNSDGKKASSVTTKTVKPADKIAALTQIAKIMNLFPKEEKEVKIALSLTELIEKSIEDKSPDDKSELVLDSIEAA